MEVSKFANEFKIKCGNNYSGYILSTFNIVYYEENDISKYDIVLEYYILPDSKISIFDFINSHVYNSRSILSKDLSYFCSLKFLRYNLIENNKIIVFLIGSVIKEDFI